MKNTLIDTRVRSLEEMMGDLMATVEQTSVEAHELMGRLECDTDRFRHSLESDTANSKEQIRQDHRDLNKQLGEIANKQGRMTENLVAPSICRILREVVDCPPIFSNPPYFDSLVVANDLVKAYKSH